MQLDHFDLDRLCLSPLNMRHSRRAPDVGDLLPSIRARGILVPLIVRPTPDGRFEVLAGRRRYHAACQLAQDGAALGPVPCALLEPGDDAAALEASLLENLARTAPDEVTCWTAFTRLVREGRDIEDIASLFATTPLAVRRALALGNLLPAIRDLYARDEIDAATIRPLTMATRAQQKDWLALWRDDAAHAPHGAALRAWLLGGQSIPTRVALFDLATYEGAIVADLFGEDSWFADPAQFWAAQNAQIARRCEALRAEGWAEVVLLERGAVFPRWDHVRRDRDAGGRVYVSVSQRGEVEVHEGWVTCREARREANAEAPATPPREMSARMTAYVDLHRHAGVQAALVAQPKVARVLMLAHALTATDNWRVGAAGLWRLDDDMTASRDANAAAGRYAARRTEVLALLGREARADLLGDGRDNDAFGPLVERLLALDDPALEQLTAVVMAESLAPGSAAVTLAGQLLGVDLAGDWQADTLFFTLLRDRATVNAMLAEVAGPAVATANLTATARVQKAIIRDCLEGTGGRTAVTGWLPRWLRFQKEGDGKAAAEGAGDDGQGERPSSKTPDEGRGQAAAIPTAGASPTVDGGLAPGQATGACAHDLTHDPAGNPNGGLGDSAGNSAVDGASDSAGDCPTELPAGHNAHACANRAPATPRGKRRDSPPIQEATWR